jgi:diguanylate cyclase (GGDEF)-like protein
LARSLAETIKSGGAISLKRYALFAESVDRFSTSVRAISLEPKALLRFTDPLTGVANRFVMLPRLEQERQRVVRTGHPCSIGMMDLDEFKLVNDTFGHRAGDEVLRQVAQFLFDHLRRYDQFYRYGGEEFVLMLPNTGADRAKRVLDRLRRGLRRQRIRLHDNTALNVSASFGIATLSSDHSVRTVIDHADQAMYAAKRAGRNRVRVWTGELDARPP